MYFNNLIYSIFLKKLIRNGKKRHALTILSSFLTIAGDVKLLDKVILKLLLPVKLYKKKKTCLSSNTYNLIHYHASISTAITWLIKGAKARENCNLSMAKSLYLECHDVLKERGVAYNCKKEYLNKLLINSSK